MMKNRSVRSISQCFNKFEIIINTRKNTEEIHSAYLIFLIMLEAKFPEQFEDFFKVENERDKIKIIEQINISKCNIFEGNFQKVTALDYIKSYAKYMSKSKESIQESIRNGSNDFKITSISNNYDYLKGYKELILMAAQFED